MRQVKTLVLAVMAVLSLSALIAATASAVVPAKVLPEGTASTFTSTGGKGTLSTLAGTTVTCESETAEGSFAANAVLGPIHIMFNTCKSAGVTCTGLAELNGTILVLGEGHLVVLELAGSALDVGILVLVNPVHFSCSIILIEVKGEVLCKATPGNVKTSKFKLVCEQTSNGDPALTTYFNEKGEEVKMGANGLLTSTNHGAFEMSAELTEAELTTNPEIEIMV